MRGSKKERDAIRKRVKEMNLSERMSYIFTYYKLPLFTFIIALLVACTTLWHELTKKEPVLYLAYENAAIGEDLNQQLTDAFLTYYEKDPERQTVTVYPDLYISDDASTENHEFAYASKMKVIGAISARKMDVVIMNEEACRLMSESGFLLDLRTLDADLVKLMDPYLTDHEVILEDNAIEYRLNEAEEYISKTAMVTNALRLNDFPKFKDAGVDGDLYAGVIANTVHPIGASTFLSWCMHS